MKYYIESADCQLITSADSVMEAAGNAVRKWWGELTDAESAPALGLIITVSEKGFDDPGAEYTLTERVLADNGFSFRNNAEE